MKNAKIEIKPWLPTGTTVKYIGIYINGGLDTAYTPERFGDLERYAKFMKSLGYNVPDVNLMDLVKMLKEVEQ